MAPSGTLTYADLEAFPDDGLRRGLIDGELIVTASPVTRHQANLRASAPGIRQSRERAQRRAGVLRPLDVLFSDRDVVEPDLIIIADERIDIITAKNIQGVPSLVIEIVSDPRLDRVRKRDLYARFGVPLYWIVDPDADRVEIHRLAGDRFAKPEILEPDVTLEVDFLPGLRIDVAALFAR